MSELVEFLRARLDEDEQVAQAATRGPWRYEIYRRSETKVEWVLSGTSDPYGVVMGDLGVGWMYGDKGPDPEHIARHDPARVLCEVEAKRRMLDELHPEVKAADESIEGEWNSNPHNADTLLELLALPYADHPDYREEWKP